MLFTLASTKLCISSYIPFSRVHITNLIGTAFPYTMHTCHCGRSLISLLSFSPSFLLRPLSSFPVKPSLLLPLPLKSSTQPAPCSPSTSPSPHKAPSLSAAAPAFESLHTGHVAPQWLISTSISLQMNGSPPGCTPLAF